MTKVAPAVFLTLLFALTASGESPEAASPTSGDAFSFVSDVTIPDGTPMGPGQSFIKTWRLRNSGSTTWNGYSLAFVEGAQMDAPH